MTKSDSISEQVLPAVPLPQRFRSGGFNMKVINRHGVIALVEKSKPTGAESYEVVILQNLPAKTFNEKSYPAREAMPCSESWGQRGWTYRDRDDAEKKMAMLIQEGRSLTKGLPATASKPFVPAPPVTRGFSWIQPDLFELQLSRGPEATRGGERRPPSE